MLGQLVVEWMSFWVAWSLTRIQRTDGVFSMDGWMDRRLGTRYYDYDYDNDYGFGFGY